MRLLGVTLSGGRDFQSAEMDRRPRQPRQLAGENGSSEYWEASFDAAELRGERLFNAEANLFRPGVARDDVRTPAVRLTMLPSSRIVWASKPPSMNTLLTPSVVPKSKPKTNLRLNH